MAAYYFQVASLPMLLWDRKAPFSLDHFISLLGSGVSPVDQEAILACTIDGSLPKGKMSSLGKSYWTLEKSLRNELVRLRSNSKAKEGKADLVEPEENPYVVEVAANAFKAASPLEAERVINQWRWKMIDELQSGHLFDADFLTGYYLKLQLLVRMNQFDLEKGKVHFQSIYENVLKTNPNQSGEKE